jgi:pimeloyl-ACP methyl ester carboxylesterase
MSSRFLIFFFMGGLLAGSSPALAQATKKTNGSASGSSEAWTGVVTYTRTQSQSDSKTVERVSGRGKDTRNWEMKYDYKATVGVVEAPEKNGSSVGKASITHTFTSKETSIAVEKNSCDRGKTWQDMTGTFVSETNISGQGKEEANVHIGVNSDGTYSVSVGLPEIKGTVSGSQSSAFSGQCTPKKGKNLTLEPTPTTIQGQSLTSDGTARLDPNDPNRLAGSYSLPIPGGVVETISWNLQKHAAPLRIVDLKFEHMKYPQWDDWQEITEQVGTVDGNWVKIKATVFNESGTTRTAELYFKETYKGDKWDGAKPDAPLKDQTFTITLEPGEARDVEMLWDSSGYAWFDDGRPRLVQRIKAELWENYKKVDDLTKNLKLKPKPVVLVPGIWSNANDFAIYQNLFTTAHSYDWKASAMVDVSSHGTIGGEGTIKPTTANRTVYDKADNLTTYVNGIRQSLNAWHIDLLAHSTGGLVARLYVHKQMDVLPDGHPVALHLMMLGTPNNGVPCADSMGWNDAFKNHMQTAKELMPEEMALFNQYVNQRKGTRFSALVGNSVPILCASPQWNDGFVSVESARYGVEDVTLTGQKHPDMVSTETFSGFVRAHVITGPRGTYPYAAAAQK